MKKFIEKNSKGRKKIPGWIYKAILLILLLGVIGYLSAPKLTEYFPEIKIPILKSTGDKEQSVEIPEQFEVTQLTEEEAAALLEKVSIPEVVTEENDKPPEENEIEEPITTEEICLSDIYAPSGSEVVFKRYHKDAVSYCWEYYDLLKKEWIPAEEGKVSTITDELFRTVSTYKLTGNAHERDMVRCSIEFADGREVVNTASLYSLPEKITGIQVSDFETDVNRYTDTLSIPATVTYESGKSETITGLFGLYFLDIKESSEYEESVSGNKIEKQTITITECDYFLTSSEEREVTVRYQDGSMFEDVIKVTGIDRIAPIISDVTIGEYQVSNINRVVPVAISIMAEDNETPYPYLKYALVHESETPDETDFHADSSWTADIDKNGVWIIYVKDESGNLASKETTIYAVDQKAPILKLTSQNEGWCKENVITAVGEDKTELKYQIKCDAQNIKGDWTSDSSFTVKENGVYTVSAMDAAGNVTTEEITINNIDNKAPVIVAIKEVGGRDER